MAEDTNIPTLKELMHGLAASIQALAIVSTEFQKEAKREIRASEELVRAKANDILIGKDTLAQLRQKKAADEAALSLGREYINLLKEHGATQEQQKDVAESFGMSAKMTVEEFDKLIGGMLKGKKSMGEVATMVGTFGNAFELLFTKFKGLFSIIGLATVALTLFDTYQEGRKFGAKVEGMVGRAPEGVLNGYGDQTAIIAMNLYGKILGYSSEQTQNFAMQLAKHGIVTNQSENATKELANVTMAGLAVQQRYGAEQSSVIAIMHMMRANLNLASDQVGGAFARLSKNVDNTNLTIPQLMDYFAQLAPAIALHGGDVNKASALIKKFGDELWKGSVVIGSFTAAFAARGGATTGGELGWLALMRQQGVVPTSLQTKLTEAGGGFLTEAATLRAWAKANPIDALQASVKVAEGLLQEEDRTPAGMQEFMGHQISRILPELGAIFKDLPAVSFAKVFTGLKTGITKEELDAIIGEPTDDDTKELLNDQMKTANATAGLFDLLKGVISGGVVRVMQSKMLGIETVKGWASPENLTLKQQENRFSTMEILHSNIIAQHEKKTGVADVLAERDRIGQELAQRQIKHIHEIKLAQGLVITEKISPGTRK